MYTCLLTNFQDGGGYGSGQGNWEFWDLLSTNENGFILVLIQYRLGAFGFLSSDDLVSHGGTPNIGIHDMHFSLDWVQKHITKFGGDPARVTISGESAGGGAVMLLAMANGGNEGTSRFSNAITASPYLPMQWDYDGEEPTRVYDQFAAEVGCADDHNHGYRNISVFDCLVAADTITLQNASAQVSGRYKYGQWSFVPVTDLDFLAERPSVQLNAGKVNGLRMLTGVSYRTYSRGLPVRVVLWMRTCDQTNDANKNNADEGQGFVRQNITSTSDFEDFTKSLFPRMSSQDLERLFLAYSISPIVQGPLFSTLGDSGPTALNQSSFATGQQQRANNLYAETTFVCPSYWLASAYSHADSGWGRDSPVKKAWKYQFSVPPSEHGADLDAYQAFNREALGKGTMTEAVRKAVQLAWGRLIIYNDPTLPDDIVTSLTKTANGTRTGDDLFAIISRNWSEWSDVMANGHQMLNINMTGGVPEIISWTPADGTAINVTQLISPGLEGRFSIVDAWSWEGGRGGRCELWSTLGASVPEK